MPGPLPWRGGGFSRRVWAAWSTRWSFFSKEGANFFWERQLEEEECTGQHGRSVLKRRARLRDQLQAVRRVAAQEQKVHFLKKAVDRDVLALVRP